MRNLIHHQWITTIKAMFNFGFALICVFQIFLIPPIKAQIATRDLIFIPLELQGEFFNKRVNVVFEDDLGYLWIGTNSGLFRYDGNHLKSYQYDVFDEHSIPNNSVISIVEDKYHNLWIGNESYLIHFDRKSEQFKGFYKNRRIIGLYRNLEGEVWASMRKAGLIKITSSEDWSDFQFAGAHPYDSTEFSNITALAEDDFGRMVAASNRGLSVLSQADIWAPTNLDFPINSIQKGKNQTFWMTSENRILQVQYLKDESSYEVLQNFEIPSAQPDFNITCILISQKSHIWIGTNYGLYQLDLKGEQPAIVKIKDRKGFLNNQITSLTLDQYQNLWVGTWKGLVKYIDRADMFQYMDLKGFGTQMENDEVTALWDDDEGNVWIGTDQIGLFKLDLKTGEKIIYPYPLENIATIKANQHKEALLIASQNKLYQLSDLDQPLPKLELLFHANEGIRSVLQISPKETWIGTWEGGLYILDEEKLIPEWKKELQDSLNKNHISILFRDGSNQIWIGTRGEGLYLVELDQERFRNFQPSENQGIRSNAFLCMAEDQNGVIWMGTRGGGLIKYEPTTNSFRTLNTQDGLPSNTIAALQIDKRNNVWFSTENGLGMYHRQEERCFSFNTDDGLTESNFLYNSSSSSDGDLLYFGALGGIYQVKVDGFEQKVDAPTTVITSFSTYGDQAEDTNRSFALLEDSKEICLPYKKNNISIGFSSLDLTAPNKNQYAYQLEGVNNYWIYPENNSRNAVFFDLSHGDYLFKVKSSNSDGIWSEEPAILKITILPPFYLTTIAYLIYALLTIGIGTVLFIVSRRWYQLKKKLFEQKIIRQKDQQHHKMRMVFFTDISHELRTPLTLIINTVEYLLKEGEQRLFPKQLYRIHRNGLKMKELISQVMDIRKHSEGEFKLKVRNYDIVAFLKGLVISFDDFAENQEISLNFDSNKAKMEGYLDPFIIEKIVSNLLSNALKYTPQGGAVSVQITEVELSQNKLEDYELIPGPFLKMIFRDTGIGMNEEDLAHIFDRYYQSKDLKSAHMTGTGIGMELVYKLVQLNRGAIFVKSIEHQFTEFEVFLPIGSHQFKVHEFAQLSPKESNIPASETPVPSVSENEANANSCDLLIVEDNQDLRETIVEILSKYYQVSTAQNGKVGFEKAKQLQPKIILSDILMPEMDGMTFLAALKNEETTKHIPTILLTAKINKEVKQESIQIGAADFIEKPFSMDFLYWKIKNILSHEAEMQEKYSKTTIHTIPTNVELESPDERMIKELIQLIEEHIASPHLSVAFLAAEVGMSRANLYRKVQKLVDDTPVSLIKKIRLERAKQILEMDKFYISEVAYMCGFKTQKYFSKCFQKAFDCSPSAYVKEHAKGKTVFSGLGSD